VKRIIMLSTLAATMAAMLALAGSASAAKPTVKTDQFEGTEFIADCGDFGYDFDVLADYVLDVRTITYVDRAGNEDSRKMHFQFHSFYYNSVTGEGFAETETGTDVFDVQTGEETSHGLSYHVTVPGEGAVLVQAGTVVYDEDGNVVFEAGPHPVEEKDFGKLCEALAPDQPT
jgi:hypothetical protein